MLRRRVFLAPSRLTTDYPFPEVSRLVRVALAPILVRRLNRVIAPSTTPESTPLFALVDGARVPVQRANGTFTIAKKSVSAEELQKRIETAPENFSANVLLRPVLQDFWLPTLAYIGGPAEIAYFAQAAVVY